MKKFIIGEPMGVRRVFGKVAVDGVGLPSAHEFDSWQRDAGGDSHVHSTTTERVTRKLGGIEAGIKESLHNVLIKPAFIKGTKEA